MKLYVKIQDKEGGHEYVVLCPFEDSNGDKDYIEAVVHHGKPCFKILADEGYCKTEYYYPADRYTIIEASIYEE